MGDERIFVSAKVAGIVLSVLSILLIACVVGYLLMVNYPAWFGAIVVSVGTFGTIWFIVYKKYDWLDERGWFS